MFSFFNKSVSDSSVVAYDYKFDSIDGGQIQLSDYKDKVLVIVNVASRCGYTPQYEDLQSLYKLGLNSVRMLGYSYLPISCLKIVYYWTCFLKKSYSI